MFRRAVVLCLTLFAGTAVLASTAAAAVVVQPVSKVVVTAPAGAIALNGTKQFTATAFYVGGGSTDVTNAATWSSSKPAVASVDSSGLAAGLTSGESSIAALYGSKTGALKLVVSKCTIMGTEGPDTLNGTPGADYICGLGGDDTINADAGADTVEGGAGVDTIHGDAGIDRLLGGTENDFIYGEGDADFLYGGAGDDELNGDAGADQLFGEAGNDALLGGDDADRLNGGADNDALDGQGGADRLMPGEGDDLLAGGDQRDVVDYSDVAGPVVIDLPNGSATGAGTDGWDPSTIEDGTGSPAGDHITALDAGSTLTGLAGTDQLVGGAGPDVIKGGAGNDSLTGNDGIDTIYGDGDDDSIVGNADNDKLFGGAGNDGIGGGSGNDVMYGDEGSDQFFGDTGQDKLFPGADNDPNVDGGADDDTVVYDGTPSGVTVDLSAGTATGGSGSDGLSDIENVTGTQSGDTITGDGFANTILGLAGVDTVSAGGGDDRLYGGAGADVIDGGDDADYILGEADGDDLDGEAGTDAVNGGAGDDSVAGGTGNDSVSGDLGVDALTGGAGNDSLNPGTGDDTSVDGGNDVDTITYGTSAISGVSIDIDAGTSTGGGGNDTFTNIEDAGGTGFDDTIFGDENANRISGMAGVDTIDGRGGVDTIFGGTGNDLLHGGSADIDSVDGQAGTDTCGEAPDTRVSCELSFNVAPTLTIVDNTNSFTEGDAPKAVDPTLTLTDDEANTESATITIGSGFESGKDFLSVSGLLGGATASYVAPTLTISGPATVAQYQTMLRNVKFENTSQDPSTTDRTITFAVFDGEDTDNTGNDVTMSVLRVNDAPIADTDSYSGGIHGVRLRVGTTHADTHEVEVAGNVLQGDTDVDTPVGNLTVTPGTLTSAGCLAASPACANNVTIASDGTFTYDPPAGQGATDTFVYTLEDNDTGDSDGTEDTNTNTVTVNYSGTRYWFVDDSAPAGGRGVSHSPLQSLAQLATGGNLNEEDGANDRIFVYSGTYTSGIDLESGQKLLGQPEGLLDGATQLVAAGGTAPAISASTLNAHVVALSTGNELQDLALGSTSGTGASLSGGSIGTATVGNTSINNTAGRAIEITTGGTLNAGFDSVSSSNSSGVGVGLTGLSGTIGLGTGTIQNATGTDFHVSGGSAAITYGGGITDTNGRLVNIDGTTGGSRTFNGAVADTTDNDNGSTGVRINSAAGPNSFTGGLKLSTGTADALEINSSTGTTTVPNTTVNSLKSTSGYALKAAASPVNLTFQRIDSTGGNTNAGINLSSVSGSGLTVTGNGSAGTGGTIANKSGSTDADFFNVDGDDGDGGNGIHLTNVSAPVSFSRMQLNDFSGFAVRAHGHSGGFSMIDSTISGTNGDNDAQNEASVGFTQLSGAADLTRTNVSGGYEDNINVYNTSGTVNRFKVSGPATIGPMGTVNGNDAIDMFITGGSFNATVENMTMTSARGDQIGYNLGNNTAGDLVVTGNTITNNHSNIAAAGGRALEIVAQQSADVTYSVTNNNMKGAKGSTVAISKAFGGGPDATLAGTVSGNTIGQAGVVGSSTTEGSAISINMGVKGFHTTSIRNNNIYGYAQHGIFLQAGGFGTSGTGQTIHDGDLNATVKGNVINTPNSPAGGLAQNGIHVNTGSNGAPTDVNDAYDVCLDIGGAGADKNALTGSSALGGTEIRVRQRFAADIFLPGYAGGSTDTTAVRSYLEPRQTMTAGSSTAGYQGPGGGFFAGPGSCPLP